MPAAAAGAGQAIQCIRLPATVFHRVQCRLGFFRADFSAKIAAGRCRNPRLSALRSYLICAGAASTVNEVVAEAASTADEVMSKAVSTADKVVFKARFTTIGCG